MRNGLVCTAAAVLIAIGVPNASHAWTSLGNGTLASVFAQGSGSKKVTVPAGTRILVRTVDSIDSSKQKTGFRFTGTLETNLNDDNLVIAPRGTKVIGQLTNASSAGKMKGSSELTIELTDIVINGNTYPLLTSSYDVKGKGEGGNTAKKVVGGAGLGALIGGIAGGGKGAGIGAAAGAGAGTVIAGSKKGQQVQIPSESLIEFRLQQPAILPISK
jgi:hypothetical protein